MSRKRLPQRPSLVLDPVLVNALVGYEHLWKVIEKNWDTWEVRYQMGAHEALDEGETKIFKRFLELFRAQYPDKLYVYPKLVSKEEAQKRGAVDSTKRKE